MMSLNFVYVFYKSTNYSSPYPLPLVTSSSPLFPTPSNNPLRLYKYDVTESKKIISSLLLPLLPFQLCLGLAYLNIRILIPRLSTQEFYLVMLRCIAIGRSDVLLLLISRTTCVC